MLSESWKLNKNPRGVISEKTKAAATWIDSCHSRRQPACYSEPLLWRGMLCWGFGGRFRQVPDSSSWWWEVLTRYGLSLMGRPWLCVWGTKAIIRPQHSSPVVRCSSIHLYINPENCSTKLCRTKPHSGLMCPFNSVAVFFFNCTWPQINVFWLFHV